MRIRTRSSVRPFYEGKTNVVFHNDGPPPFSFVISTSSTKPPFCSHTKQEAIWDELNAPVSRDERARAERRLAYALKISDPALAFSVHSDLVTQSLQVHKCDHTSTEVDTESTYVSFKTQFSATKHYTYTYEGAHGLCRFLGNLSDVSNSALLSAIAGASRSYSSSAFYEPDWFALLDSWHENCNNLMPSSSLLGESIVENAIFIDAFKTLINPSHLLKVFLREGKKIAKRKSTLGQVSQVLRTSSNTFLGYNFGVKPAISQIVDLFGAHRKVERRLEFLRSNVGGYVPVRARTKIPSTFSNPAVTGSSPKILCDSKETIGVISALAKVRPDLDFVQDWKAYMQYFGLHRSLELAWELVPFSFVVDWVTNAGDYISKYCRPNFASPFYNIRNICHSKKTVLTESLWIPDGMLFPETASNLVGGPVKIGSWITTNYTRRPGLPQTSGSVDFTRLGTFHAIASGSMLIQKILK